MDKKIIISGKNNRYQMKKILDYAPLNTQPKLNDANNISKKMNGYKSQDKKRGWISTIELTDILEILEKKYCCYCEKEVLVVYDTKLHPMQWTLDRINNNLPHNKENVVLSCLKCNLKRRKTPIGHFLFSKNVSKIS